MVLEIFSARVREARLANGLVQADLASLLGVRTKAITDYEAGSYLPKPPMLEKMSDVLKQPVAWFFTPGAQSLDRQPGRPRSRQELHMDARRTIGAILRAAREEVKARPQDVMMALKAQGVNVSLKDIERWESGESIVTDYYPMLETLYGKPEGYFVGATFGVTRATRTGRTATADSWRWWWWGGCVVTSRFYGPGWRGGIGNTRRANASTRGWSGWPGLPGWGCGVGSQWRRGSFGTPQNNCAQILT